MAKRKLALLVAALMLIAALAACGGGGAAATTAAAAATTAAAADTTTAAAADTTTAAAADTTTAAAADTTTAAAEDATTAAAADATTAAASADTGSAISNEDWPEVEVSFWEVGDVYAFQEGNADPYADAFMEKAQIKLVNRPITSQDYTEKIPLWAATNDLPDIWMYDSGSAGVMWQWKEQGLIRDIPQDLSAYPTFEKYMTEDAIPLYQKVMEDGVYWAIPRADFVVPMTYTHGIPYMRKADYEAMGSPALPNTVDEWFEFCGLVQQTFPNRIVISSKFDQISNMFGEFCPELANDCWYYYEDKGMWAPPFFNRHDQLMHANRFFNAGYVDKDILTTMDGNVFRDRFISGDAVIWINTPFPGHMNNETQPPWSQKNPTEPIGDALMMMNRPSDAQGNRYIAPLKYWSENFINSQVTDEQLAAIFRLYEFFLSEEGFEFRRFGILGKDYEKNGDEINIIREKNEAGQFKPLAEIYPSGYFAKCWSTWDEEFPFTDPAIDPKIRAFGEQYLKFKDETFLPQPDSFNILLTTISTEAKTELPINTAGEDTIRLIGAQDYEAEWTAMMAKYEGLGLWEMAEEINTIGREMGYIE